jgi:hypothetical protein
LYRSKSLWEHWFIGPARLEDEMSPQVRKKRLGFAATLPQDVS